jgi:hypothetical protein
LGREAIVHVRSQGTELAAQVRAAMSDGVAVLHDDLAEADVLRLVREV